MKYITCLVALMIMISCDNSLNLVEEGTDVSVVYGLLSSTSDEQVIRLERGFIDSKTSATDLAKDADQLYYPNASVQINNLTRNTSYSLDRVNAKDLGYTREAGFFVTDPNYIYYRKGSRNDFKPGDQVRVLIKKDENAEPVRCDITLLDTLLVVTPKSEGTLSFPLKGRYKIQWAANGKNQPTSCSVNAYIHYKEANQEDEEPELVPKVLKWKIGNVANESALEMAGIDFFKHMGKSLETNPKYIRTLEYIDFEFIYTGKEMARYKQFVNANIGITSSQPIPPYTNLSDGLGLIAERNVQYTRNVFLGKTSKDSLKMGVYTKYLGFQ